ncbi:MAG: DUF6455 family protein [Sedimentitalea sp.]
MHTQSKLKHHADLFDTMAETLGIDLQEATLTGQLSMDDLADGVVQCANCSDPGYCAKWLGAAAGAGDATPSYCRNSDLLTKLKP